MTGSAQDNRSAAATSIRQAAGAQAEVADESGVLQVKDLRVQYGTPRGPVKAVDGVTFTLRPGERFGLVGESGSGKTTTAFALMRLIEPPGEITGGRALLGGVDLLKLSDEEMRQARFAQIALIPQGAMNSLNPVMRIGISWQTRSRHTMRGRVKGNWTNESEGSWHRSDFQRTSPKCTRTNSAEV